MAALSMASPAKGRLSAVNGAEETIFAPCLDGMKPIGIAERFNVREDPDFTAYKIDLGMNCKHPKCEISGRLGPDSSVRRILKNFVRTSYTDERPIALHFLQGDSCIYGGVM